MPAEQNHRVGAVAGLATAISIVCCALPVALGGVAAGATLAGIGVRAWLGSGAGLTVAVVGLVGWRRRHAGAEASVIAEPGSD